MVHQLLIEINNVPMRVSRSQNGDKPKNVSVNAKPFAVGLNHAFAGQLGGAIKRSLDGERAILRSGYGLRLPIDRAGGGESHPADAVGTNRLQYMERSPRVLLKILARVLDSEAHIRIGCQVKGKVAASHGPSQGRRIEIIAFDQGKSRMFPGILQELRATGGEVIPADYSLAVGQQGIH